MSDQADPLVGELVDDAPPAPPDPPRSQAEQVANQVIELAADAAMQLPGAPGREEFLTLAMTARLLSMSGAAPKLVRDNPHLAFHVALVGRDLGISPSAALELIDVIDGKGGPQLSLSPQLLNGQIRRLGLGQIVPAERSNVRAVAVVVGPGGITPKCRRLPFREDGRFDHAERGCACDVLGDSEFTWEDAQMAGLAGKACKPGAHRNGGDKCGCNHGYITYPKRMLWWRAAGFAADDHFPEAGLGLYSPEALGAVVDADGRAIDPADVALPEGYEPKGLPSGARGGRGAQGGDPGPLAPTEVLYDLRVRIGALPADAKDWLRQRWSSSKAAGFRVERLPEAHLGAVKAMVLGAEARARASGTWNEQESRAQSQADLAARMQADAAQAAAEASQDPSDAGAKVEPSSPPTAPAAGSDGSAGDGGAGAAPATSPDPPAPSTGATSPPGAEPSTPGADSPAPGASGPVGGVTLGFDEDARAVILSYPEEQAKAVLAEVNGLDAESVGKELSGHGQPVAGRIKELRYRLAAARLLASGPAPSPAEPGAEDPPPVIGAGEGSEAQPAPS